MPKLLFATVPTDEVLNKEGKVRFPGAEAAVSKLTEAGWEVEVIDPTWPKPLEAAKSGGFDAILVSTYKATPRSRATGGPGARIRSNGTVRRGILQGVT